MIRPQITRYIEEFIIPQYQQLDISHSPDHVRQVIANSLKIAQPLDVDLELVYVVAAYHDLGLLAGRQGHEAKSQELLLKDENLSLWFTPNERRIMGEAVADHRASLAYEPRSIYGKIVSEADRDINFRRILKRTLVYAMEKKQLREINQLTREAHQYMTEKYGPDSGLIFWLDFQPNIDNLAELHRYLADEKAFKQASEEIYQEILAENGGSL